MKSRVFSGIVLGFVFLTICTFCTGCKKKNIAEVLENQNSSFPQAIVALSPASTEILFAVGAGNQVAAISDFADYPPEALTLPVVGGFDGKTLSMEKILSFKPDLVYLTDGMHNFLIDQLNQYEIKFYLSKADSIEAIKNEIFEIGKITGHEKNAQNLVAQIEKTISSVTESKKAGTEKKVYYEIWTPPFMSVGSTSFINDVISKAGGTNIFGDINEDYPIVSEESIIARSPDVILIPISSGISSEQIAKRKGWENISAVKNNAIYIVDDNLISRPSPRIGETVKVISDLLK